MSILDAYLEQIQSKVEQSTGQASGSMSSVSYGVSPSGTTSVAAGINPYESFPSKKKPLVKSKKKGPLIEQVIEEPKRILVDFDGTIHRFSRGFGDGRIYDNPTDFCREALSFLKNEGFEICIFTTRLSKEVNPDTWATNEKFIKQWLNEYDIPYDRITSDKLLALAYIDDRGIRFSDWKDTLNILEDLGFIKRE